MDKLNGQYKIELDKAELKLKKQQLETEKWKKWSFVATLFIAVCALGGIFYQACQVTIQQNRKVSEDFRTAIQQLNSDNPVGRAGAFYSIISFIENKEDRILQRGAMLALVQALSMEENYQVSIGVNQALNLNILQCLEPLVQKESLLLAIEQLRTISWEIGKYRDEQKIYKGFPTDTIETRRMIMVKLIERILPLQDYPDIDFSSLNLDGMKFQGATIPNANFTFSSLLRTSFEACDLHNAKFQSSYIKSVFKNCNLNNAEFKPNIFYWTGFTNCTLHDTILDNYSFVTYNEHIEPVGALMESVFTDSELVNTTFSRPNILILFYPDDAELIRSDELIQGILKYRDPEGPFMGGSWGIRKTIPSLGTYVSDYFPGYYVPIETLCYQGHHNLPDVFYEECKKNIRRIVKQLETAKISEYTFDRKTLQDEITKYKNLPEDEQKKYDPDHPF